jgi:adenylate cyclase
MNALADWVARHVGHWPVRAAAWSLAGLFCAWIALDVFVLGVSAGTAWTTYDAMVRARLWSAPPDPRIVIVDIDEASLARMAPAFGRWPWPRDTLATVLDHVEKAGPAAIVWDVVFSDPDALSPGGDAALDAAARRSVHSHFAVVRLPAAADAQSRLRREHLPGLWAAPGAGTSTVALVPPALAGVAAGRLGYNNGMPDADGVLRRYRYGETLADGGVLQSIAASVAAAVEPRATRAAVQGAAADPEGELIAWRQRAGAYPRLPFWQVFEQADGAVSPGRFAGKIVIIGSTAPSLHDVHPTPLSPLAPGVDALATAIDNAVNGRQLRELPRGLQAALAMLLCAGLAWLAQRRSLSALDPLLWILPLSLLGVSYASLHGLPLFVDLHLAAGFALLYLAVLRVWKRYRRRYWSNVPDAAPLALMALRGREPWDDAALDSLVEALEHHAPACRFIAGDAEARWPSRLFWPELARYAAVLGPEEELRRAWPALARELGAQLDAHGSVLGGLGARTRQDWAMSCLQQWGGLPPVHEQDKEREHEESHLAGAAAGTRV